MVGRSVLEGRRGVRAWLLAALACLLLCAAASLLAAAQADAIQRLAQCADNVDNDGDGDVDFPEDAGCATAAITTETPDAVTQCSDNIDQPGTSDGDAFVDYPEDPGCTSAADTNENNPSPLPQCGNAVDDDGDGRTNFNLNRFLTDHGCIAASDNSELNTTCSDGIDNDGDGRTDFPLDWGCAVPSAGPNQADTDEADPPQCRDGRDNDGDALIDTDTNIPGQARDPDCADPDDRDEAPDPQCADARDNDRDGRTDFPADPGCTSASDDDETDPPGVCADGLDNDADGLVDLLDPGCSAADDGDETNVTYQLPPVIGGTVTPSGTQLPSAPSSALASGRGATPTLSPFPVVRLAGRAERRFTKITLLRVVQAPVGAKVTVFCSGVACPRKSVSQVAGTRSVRVRTFERRVRVGTSLRIYVTKKGFIGKYTRFRIQRNRPPLRQDRCARFAGADPRPCPAS